MPALLSANAELPKVAAAAPLSPMFPTTEYLKVMF